MIVMQVLRALNLFSAALLAGGMSWVLLVTVPAFRRMSQVESVRTHQTQLDDLPDRYLPAASLCAAATGFALAFVRGGLPRRSGLFYLLGACVMAPAGLITVFQNVPTNRMIRRWSIEAVPAEYPAIRQAWNRRHLVRTLCCLAALLCFILANVTVPPSRSSQRPTG